MFAADTISRRDFQRQLREHLPEALETIIWRHQRPKPDRSVDLAQAAIGPGMAIYSQYAGVLNQDGTPMRVHDALVRSTEKSPTTLPPMRAALTPTRFLQPAGSRSTPGPRAVGEGRVLRPWQGHQRAGCGAGRRGAQRCGQSAPAGLGRLPHRLEPRHRPPRPRVGGHAPTLIRALNTQGEAAAGALLAAMPDKAEPVRQVQRRPLHPVRAQKMGRPCAGLQ